MTLIHHCDIVGTVATVVTIENLHLKYNTHGGMLSNDSRGENLVWGNAEGKKKKLLKFVIQMFEF